VKIRYKRHALGAALIGTVGLLTGLGMNYLHDIGAAQHLPDNGNIIPLVAVPGAAVAGAICAGMFGHHGYLGWFWAFLGGVSATLLGAFLAGSLLAPSIGGLFGVIAVFEYLSTQPVLLAAWCVMMAIAHQVIVFIAPFRE